MLKKGCAHYCNQTTTVSLHFLGTLATSSLSGNSQVGLRGAPLPRHSFCLVWKGFCFLFFCCFFLSLRPW